MNKAIQTLTFDSVIKYIKWKFDEACNSHITILGHRNNIKSDNVEIKWISDTRAKCVIWDKSIDIVVVDEMGENQGVMFNIIPVGMLKDGILKSIPDDIERQIEDDLNSCLIDNIGSFTHSIFYFKDNTWVIRFPGATRGHFKVIDNIITEFVIYSDSNDIYNENINNIIKKYINMEVGEK